MADIDDIMRELGALRAGVDGLNSKIDGLKHDLDQDITALSKVHSIRLNDHSDRIRSLEGSRAWARGILAFVTVVPGLAWVLSRVFNIQPGG